MSPRQEIIRPTFPTVAEPPFPKVTYGTPFYEACAKSVRELLRVNAPYIIASKTLSQKTSFLTQLQEALGPNVAGTWIGIANHTPLDAMLPIIEDIREKKADCIITLGGGSISDGAKLISFALANDVTTADQLASLPRISHQGFTVTGNTRSCKTSQMPVICIPITLSGGEYSKYAGATNSKHHKIQFTNDRMFPSLVILDPQLTTSTPVRSWLSSGVRAIDHCVEGYLSKQATDEGDAAATEALALLVKGLLRTKLDPDDREARLQSQLDSNLSMTLLYLMCVKGASHGIGHQLGPLGVAHGDTSCILLPAVCKYNAPVNGDKQEKLKELLCREAVVQDVLKRQNIQQDSADLADVLRAIFDTLEMPRTLGDVGVTVDRLDELAESCLDEPYVGSNPRPMNSKEDVLEVLRAVL